MAEMVKGEISVWVREEWCVSARCPIKKGAGNVAGVFGERGEAENKSKKRY
ncbi:hypothetical protein [uncultured Ruminococcus sp.]|uniref:hypothetical protein n=1 Tax=uncultured Ruminococcus sp. TaxID=165186 RepID=UPI0025F26D83|nr:hypothetical protein [uncultured Ruminococcus sp.]